MEMGMYLVTAVLTEGRSPREVAAAHGVSKTWVYELLARYRAEGAAGLGARSRRPRRSPTKIADRFEDEIVACPQAAGRGRLRRRRGDDPLAPPAAAPGTLFRPWPRSGGCSTARGFVTPQPHKRPEELLASLPSRRCPTSAGRPTSPTWRSPTAPTSRSSTSSTTTPGSASRPGVRDRPNAADVVHRLPPAAARHWGFPPACSPTTAPSSPPAPRRRPRRHRTRAARARHRLQALPALPPPDLRQGRTLPPDPQEVARQAAAGRPLAAAASASSTGSSTTTTPYGPTAPSADAHPHDASARHQSQSAPRPPPPIDATLPGPPRPRRHARQRHPPPQQPPPPHRHRPPATKAHPSSCSSPTATSGSSPPDGELLRHLTLDPNRDYQPLNPGGSLR